jgi:hypothetical protein
MSCALPGALLGSVWTATHAPTYVEGVRSSAVAGGDNCSRWVRLGAGSWRTCLSVALGGCRRV